MENKEMIAHEIVLCLNNLSDTDYKAIKYAEGMISEQEYESIRQQRQYWRNRINELEAML